MCGTFHLCCERGLYNARVGTVDGEIRSSAIELEVEVLIGVPCLQKTLIVHIF